jgi:hypothetical protein
VQREAVRARVAAQHPSPSSPVVALSLAALPLCR